MIRKLCAHVDTFTTTANNISFFCQRFSIDLRIVPNFVIFKIAKRALRFRCCLLHWFGFWFFFRFRRESKIVSSTDELCRRCLYLRRTYLNPCECDTIKTIKRKKMKKKKLWYFYFVCFVTGEAWASSSWNWNAALGGSNKQPPVDPHKRNTFAQRVVQTDDLKLSRVCARWVTNASNRTWF